MIFEATEVTTLLSTCLGTREVGVPSLLKDLKMQGQWKTRELTIYEKIIRYYKYIYVQITVFWKGFAWAYWNLGKGFWLSRLESWPSCPAYHLDLSEVMIQDPSGYTGSKFFETLTIVWKININARTILKSLLSYKIETAFVLQNWSRFCPTRLESICM